MWILAIELKTIHFHLEIYIYFREDILLINMFIETNLFSRNKIDLNIDKFQLILLKINQLFTILWCTRNYNHSWIFEVCEYTRGYVGYNIKLLRLFKDGLVVRIICLLICLFFFKRLLNLVIYKYDVYSDEKKKMKIQGENHLDGRFITKIKR